MTWTPQEFMIGPPPKWQQRILEALDRGERIMLVPPPSYGKRQFLWWLTQNGFVPAEKTS